MKFVSQLIKDNKDEGKTHLKFHRPLENYTSDVAES